MLRLSRSTQLNSVVCALLLAGAAMGAHAGNGNGNGKANSNGNGGGATQSCSFSDLSVGGACAGLYSGNLLNAADAGAVAGILNTLTQSSAWTADAVSTATAVRKLELNGGNTVNFAGLMYGMTLVGIHKGAAGTTNGTAFYYFDAGAAGLDSFNFNLAGSSGAVLYSTGLAAAVPEPQSYALMAAGLGALAFLARRRSRRG